MTVVNVGLRVPSATGRKPAGGRLGWQATKRLVDGSVVVLPARTSVELVGETTTVDIEPGVYWFTEDTNGGESAYRIVPDVGPVDYAAMAAVDPATLEPEAVPVAAWYAYTDTLSATAQTAATAAQQARDAATESQTSAQASAASASTSALSAGSSADTALSAAGIANGAATQASTDSDLAAGYMGAAQGYATNAGNSATSAAGSAASAESARAGMITTGTVDETGHLILGRVDANPQDAGYVVGPPITLEIIETTTGPDTPGTPGPQGLTGPKGDPGGIVLGTALGTSDLNNITAAGTYYQSDAATGTMARNYPRDVVAGNLVVFQAAATNLIKQVFYPINGAFQGKLFYVRQFNTNSWTAWAAYGAQRVDQTAGRAIYAWDDVNNREQIIYGDTGWRNLPLDPATFTTDNGVQVRRQGNRVSLRLIDTTFTTAASTTPIFYLPAGFRAAYYANPLLQQANNIKGGPLYHLRINPNYDPTFPHGVLVFEYTRSALVASVRLQGEISWETSDAWPTVLPGTAHGTIPNL